MRTLVYMTAALGVLVFASQCRQGTNPVNQGGEKVTIIISSSAFNQGGLIPSRYTCDGTDMSPPLEWSGIPEGTRELALICDDPDAPSGDWVHWVMYNMPPDLKGLPEAVPKTATLNNGSVQGITDFRRTGYGGPCPPGGTHRYYFRLYALDKKLGLGTGLGKNDLLRAVKGHVIAQAELMGTYKRQ